MDLFLIHWPHAFQEDGELFPKDKNDQMIYSTVDYIETWREMEKAVDDGLAKGIGVSNFNRNQVERVLSIARIKPVMNQIECHPYLSQQKLSAFLKEKHIAVTGYSPLGSPNRPWVTANDPVLLEDPKVILSRTIKINNFILMSIFNWNFKVGQNSGKIQQNSSTSFDKISNSTRSYCYTKICN